MTDVLSGYSLYYEDLPKKKTNARKSRKDIKMSKEATKQAKSYKKTRGEHIKDIVITILVTAVIAFIAGANYQNKQQAKIDTAVHHAVSNQSTAPAKK